MTPVNPDVASLSARIAAASGWYHRLILLHPPAGVADGSGLQSLAAELGILYVNVSLALSEALLPLPRSERAAHVGPVLESIVAGGHEPCVLLDRIEVLFQPDLRVEVLARLRQLSRQRTLVVTWPGQWSGGTLTYASFEHPEHLEERGIEPLSVFPLSPIGIPQP